MEEKVVRDQEQASQDMIDTKYDEAAQYWSQIDRAYMQLDRLHM